MSSSTPPITTSIPTPTTEEQNAPQVQEEEVPSPLQEEESGVNDEKSSLTALIQRVKHQHVLGGLLFLLMTCLAFWLVFSFSDSSEEENQQEEEVVIPPPTPPEDEEEVWDCKDPAYRTPKSNLTCASVARTESGSQHAEACGFACCENLRLVLGGEVVMAGCRNAVRRELQKE